MDQPRRLTVADLRAALEGIPDETPVVVLYDSYFGVERADLIEYDPDFQHARVPAGPAFLIGAE